MNVFTISPQDQSIAYLTQVFGNVGSVLVSTTSSVSLMGTMFQTFNTIVLAIGAMMVVYVTIMSVLTTAHEGEFMGKKFHSLWVPLRMVFGIAGLVPISAGYCAIQILMMWVVVQGVGAADTLWLTVLNYINTVGSPYATVSPVGVGIDIKTQSLFQSLTCQANARANYNYNSPATDHSGGYYCGAPANASSLFCTRSQQDMLNIVNGPQVAVTATTNTTYSMGPDGACGNLQYCNLTATNTGSSSTNGDCTNNPTKLSCLSCKAQQASLQQIVTTLGAIAQMLVISDYQYRQYYDTNAPASAPTSTSGTPPATTPPPSFVLSYCSANNIPQNQCCHAPANPSATTCPATGQLTFDSASNNGGNISWVNVNQDTIQQLYWPYVLSPAVGGTNFVKSAANYYVANLSQVIAAYLASLNAGGMPSNYQDAYNKGWIYAGAYYYVIAQMNHSNLMGINPPLNVNTANAGNPDQSGNSLSTFRTNYTASGQLITYLISQSSGGSTSAPQVSQLTSLLGGAASGIMTSFMASLTGGGPGTVTTNPLSSLQALGETFLIIAQVVFAVFLVIAIVMGIVGAVAGLTVLGTGLPSFGSVIQVIFMVLTPMAMFFIGTFLTFGAMLAIYTPLIPYVVFTFGVIGWFIATIEAMVAAPLVALGILSPSGQHEIMGKAEAALMLLLNLFLRPALMVFGMMAAMLLSAAVVTMINAGFQGVMGSINSQPGLVELILFIAAYVSLIVTALNKCFSLIYHIPDRVLTWIGGQATSYGEAESLGAVKHGVEGAASGVGGASAAIGKGQGIGKKAAKGFKADVDKKKAAAGVTTPPPATT